MSPEAVFPANVIDALHERDARAYIVSLSFRRISVVGSKPSVS
jgi:hypothetical protein